MLSMIMLALAVNGGLYMGTIAWTAYKSEEVGKAIDLFTGVQTLTIG